MVVLAEMVMGIGVVHSPRIMSIPLLSSGGGKTTPSSSRKYTMIRENRFVLKVV